MPDAPYSCAPSSGTEALVMSEIDQKTTSLSSEPWRPLEVEYLEHKHSYKIVDGGSVRIPRTSISFVSPASHHFTRTRIANISPQTALNLLVWLEQERATLEKLAAESEATP